MRVAIYFRITKTGEILRNGHTRRCVETTYLYEFSSITSAKEYAQKYSCNPLVWSDDGYKVTVVAYFQREVDAQEFIKQYSGYGRVYKENVCHEYKVFDSILDYNEYDKNTLVNSAKSKLSKEELDALTKSIQSTN